jgi:hypothetical protein
MSGLYPDDQVIEVFGDQVKWPGLGPDGKFTNGSFTDPMIKPSFIPAETLNLLVDNIQRVISEAGLDPNNIEQDQLFRALQSMTAAKGDQALEVAQKRNIVASTVDLVAGTSALPTGQVYLVYG